jgi:tRNA nucleotidyltransferase (CCA-adding enzyme)
MKQIISKISKTSVPSKIVEQSKKQIAELAYNLVEKEIKKYPEVLGLEFGGSFAKGTWLSKDADIDIFIRFKKIKILLLILKKFIKKKKKIKIKK